MGHYEVWERNALISSSGTCAISHYTIDEAFISCKRLSKGSVMKRVVDAKNPGPNGWYGPTNFLEVEVPHAYALVDRTGAKAIIRGWATNGKWFDAKDCKRCANSGENDDGLEMSCKACGGASFSPSIT